MRRGRPDQWISRAGACNICPREAGKVLYEDEKVEEAALWQSAQ